MAGKQNKKKEGKEHDGYDTSGGRPSHTKRPVLPSLASLRVYAFSLVSYCSISCLPCLRRFPARLTSPLCLSALFSLTRCFVSLFHFLSSFARLQICAVILTLLPRSLKHLPAVRASAHLGTPWCVGARRPCSKELLLIKGKQRRPDCGHVYASSTPISIP